MSQISMYLYDKCSSCKNAEVVLKSAGMAYERRDIFRDRLTVKELKELFAKTGKRPIDLLSRRSIPFKQLDLADRELTDNELIALMAEHPALLRRPIIVAPGMVQVGFNRTALESLAQQHGQG